MVRVYVDLASVPSNVKCVNPQVSESTQIQSRIINKTYESRLDFLTIQLQSSRELAILILQQQIQSSLCTITRSHMTSHMITIQTRIIQIRMKSIHEIHQIQSSSHTRIMRNQIHTSRYTYYSAYAYTSRRIYVWQCTYYEINRRIYRNAKTLA